MPNPNVLLILSTLLLPSYSIYFDELCQDESSTTVQFTEQQIGTSGKCICFNTGTYEYDYCTPPTHIIFHVTSPSCGILLPFSNTTQSIRKLPSFPHTLPPPTNIKYVFPECHNTILSRKKRQDAPAPPADPAPAPGPEPAPAPPAVTTTLNDTTDEDFINTGTEIGQYLMLRQMNLYIETVIAKLTGLQAEGGVENGGGGGRRYPVVKLLEYTKLIMQKTCTVINPDFFDLALNSFINLQLQTYHLKEPYIGYSAFKRIELAMNRCLVKAQPHVFVVNVTDKVEGSGGELCDNRLPTQTSNVTVKKEEEHDVVVPQYASSFLEAGTKKIAEPLIETVWKMLVSAHSYCYLYFSSYYNDHHSYTVALLPMFTNAIQEVWMNGGAGYDLGVEGNKLYGGLLGDVTKIMQDLDYCVGASRVECPYPWFLNRPGRVGGSDEWRRKKREAEEDYICREGVASTCDN